MRTLVQILYLVGVGLCAYITYRWFSTKGDQKYLNEIDERKKVRKNYIFLFIGGLVLVILASIIKYYTSN